MSKTYIKIFGACLLTLAGCSRDEVKDMLKGHEIDFMIAVDTRADEVTTDNIGSFFVTAIDGIGATYFSDVEFSDEDGDNYFTSDSRFYWPASGSLDFFAYSPGAQEMGAAVSIDKTSQIMTGFTTASSIADQVDFITAKAEGSKEEDADGVALEFAHQLSQIEIRAKNDNSGYVYKVKGVKIAKVASRGDFDFATETWGNITDKVNYVTEHDSEITLSNTAESIMGDSGNAMVIPQDLNGWASDTDKTNESEGSYIAVKINVKTSSGMNVFPKGTVSEYGWVAIPVSNTWKPGIRYIYTLDFTTGAGKIDPEDPATPGEEGEDVMGNTVKFSMDTHVIGWTN